MIDAPTMIEPVSECVQQITGWVDGHFWLLAAVTALAVFGAVVFVTYAMQLLGVLIDRGWEYWRKWFPRRENR